MSKLNDVSNFNQELTEQLYYQSHSENANGASVKTR